MQRFFYSILFFLYYIFDPTELFTRSQKKSLVLIVLFLFYFQPSDQRELLLFPKEFSCRWKTLLSKTFLSVLSTLYLYSRISGSTCVYFLFTSTWTQIYRSFLRDLVPFYRNANNVVFLLTPGLFRLSSSLCSKVPRLILSRSFP